MYIFNLTLYKNLQYFKSLKSIYILIKHFFLSMCVLLFVRRGLWVFIAYTHTLCNSKKNRTNFSIDCISLKRENFHFVNIFLLKYRRS